MLVIRVLDKGIHERRWENIDWRHTIFFKLVQIFIIFGTDLIIFGTDFIIFGTDLIIFGTPFNIFGT